MNEKKLLIATNNKGKLKEIRAILGDLEVQLLSPADLDLELDVEEDGQTYAENATKKALAFSQASGLTSLADDSGLEVDALVRPAFIRHVTPRCRTPPMPTAVPPYC